MQHLILEFVLRSTLAAACTSVLLFALRIRGARLRHTAWTGLLILMLVLPISTAWGPRAVLPLLTPQSAVPAATSAVEITQDASIQLPAPPAQPRPWSDALIILYVAGAVWLLARLITGTLRARLLIRHTRCREGHLTSSACVAPITVGLLKPVVLLPSRFTEWSTDELHLVLAHENEHARRRDPLVHWLALFNRAIFWFHPLAWWLERHLSALAEEACDDAVLLHGHSAQRYSEYLLSLARTVERSGSRVKALGMAMPGTFLPSRIRRLMTAAAPQPATRMKLAFVISACTVIAVISAAGAIGYADPVQAPPPPPVAPAPPPPPPPPPPPVPASAHTAQSFSGVAIDPSGAVVPRAVITLTNATTGAVISSATDQGGKYRLENLNPGDWNLTVKAPGFKAANQTGIHIASGEAHNGGAIALQLGSMSESVSVTALRLAGTPVGTPLASAPPTPIGIPLDQPYVAPKPAPATYREPDPGRPIKVGGNVQAANLINPVKPAYPVGARERGIQGTVKIQAVLMKDGTAGNLRVIASPDSELTQAALDAVKEWRYYPTMLNGEAVETITSIDVNFELTN